MTNLLEDISTLTEVTEKTLEKLTDVSNYCISHAVHEAQCEKKDITTIDIGIGELTIRFIDQGVQYRFVPSDALEKMIVQTVVGKTSPMITRVETKLQDKIDKAYKEVL